MLIYAATIFLSAFLLFQVQPLIAKFILPWFGGSAAVWSAALLFFQLLLLAGYFYAHCLIRYLTPKRQLWVHLTVLAASLATLPIIPSAYWKPAAGGDPTLKILLLLGATIGLPYTLLSATSPLLQAWYLRTHEGAIPYRLFALSNFGSMLALLSYPFMIEPQFALSRQAILWSMGYAAFVLVCGIAAWKSDRGTAVQTAPEIDKTAATPPKASTMILWVGLAACASSLLLATTSHLTANVAPIPLLWVVPLSLYLLSFIFCFESGRLYQRWIFMPLLLVSLALYAKGMVQFEDNADVIKILIPALCGALFVCCMVCHGELARRKPHPQYLTQFYLMVSIGGAVGGLFVALAAPHLFHTYLEMPIAVAACGLLAVCSLWHDDDGALRPAWMRFAMLAAATGFAAYLGRQQVDTNRYYSLSVRNFYGVLHVRDDPGGDDGSVGQRVLIHGTINHGTELKAPNSGRIPTSYFGVNSGISRAIRAKGDSGPIRLGILGLGAGVTASLARAGDTLHYYEINPLIPQLASTQFSFFPSCPADKRILMGDGRLVLESLPSENLDVLTMDAFSSDAVPVHLLTREAYEIYRRHLKPDGIIIVNISNRYLNLEPIVAQSAKEIGWSGVKVTDDGEAETFYVASTWVVLSPQASFFKHPFFRDAAVAPIETSAGFRPWTDDYSDIVQAVTSLPTWLFKFLNR
jgi:spermidine synthase